MPVVEFLGARRSGGMVEGNSANRLNILIFSVRVFDSSSGLILAQNTGPETVSIDGKTVCGSHDRSARQQADYLLQVKHNQPTLLAAIVDEFDRCAETSYLDRKVRELMKHLRNHWGAENSLHHTRDVTFTGDASRIRKGAGPEIAPAFRRLALSILKSDRTIQDNVRGKRLRAGRNLENLNSILLAFQAV